MKIEQQHNSARYHTSALLTTIVVHALLALLAMLVVLDTPDKAPPNEPISLELEAGTARLHKRSQKQLPISGTQTTLARRMKPSARAYPATIIRLSENDIILSDVHIRISSQTKFQHNISTKLLDEMSDEEAFDKLMGLLKEYPEYKETILGKMLAGKDMQLIPDLYVSTGLKRLKMQMKFKTKYEYEAMRQQFMYGPYNDPVLGPQGYQKTGVQVNLIELLGWLRGLIEGK